MSHLIKCEWLADLLMGQRDVITQFWIEAIRAEHIDAYNAITDEQLRIELPPTAASMIEALRTGELEGPRKHSFHVVKRRIADGFSLPDLQMSLHALQTAVMRIVKCADLGLVKEFEALQVTSNLYYVVALIAAAEYENLRIEQQIRFSTTYEFGIALSKNLDLGAVLDIAVNKVAECFSGESAAILLAGSDGDQSGPQSYYNLDEDLAKALPDICESLHCETCDASGVDVRDTTCKVTDIRVDRRLERWSELLVSSKHLSMVCAPLVAKERRLGVVVILWSDVHTATKIEIDFLFAMTGHIASALQNAFLYEEAQGKRELGILLDSSRAFASSLDMRAVLNEVAKMAAEAVEADIAIVSVPCRMRGRTDTVFYTRGKDTSLVHQIVDAVIAEGETSGFGSLGTDFVGGKAMLYSNLSDLPGRMRSLSGIAASGVIVPLRQKDVFIGAFALVSLAPNVLSENDVLLATGLSDLAAVAIENARLYEYERNIAETLQRGFLPSSLPSIEGYEVAAYYRPALAEAEIGGDFYDAFATRNDTVGLVIGDVSGKGLKAAIPTAMGRYVIRAYASENPLPSNVIMRFNRIFYENAPDYMFMTALYGVLDPATSVLTYVSAGHEPPLLYSSVTNRVTDIGNGGLCLGVIANTTYTNNKIQLQPNDVFFLYTDGATDVKGDSGRLGIEGLKQLFLSSLDGSAEEIVKNVYDGIWEYCHGMPSDDVALILLKRLAE